MPEIAKILLAASLGMLIAIAGIVLGYVAGRRSVAPRRRGYDPDGVGEATVEIRTSDPESEAVAAELASEPEVPEDFGMAMYPVSQRLRLNPLEDETVRVKVAGVRIEGSPATEAPWAWLTRNGNPDKDRACLTRTQEQRKLDDIGMTTRWPVRHPGIGVLYYESEEEARIAAGTAGEMLAPERLGGAVVINGPGGPTRHWGVVHFGPDPGVCSVDEDGCGYCIGQPCRLPKSSRDGVSG